MAAVSDLELRVLGLLEVSRGGDPVVLGWGAALNLLAGLAVSANNVVATDVLAEFVWGDRQPSHPRAALHTKVSRLRKVLGDEVIETVVGGYRLQADSCQLDLLRFDGLLASAADAATDAEALAALDEAMGLWRGTPLSNVSSARLQSEVVPRLVERHITACERWAEVSLRMGRPGPVAERLAPLVEAHPFRESLVGHLMLARYRAGRPADALAAYDTVRRTLHDQLGVDPSRALQDLHTKILRDTVDRVEIRPRVAGEQPRWAGRGPSPGGLVGRAADQQMLARSLRSHHAVTVVGTAGVGKTELALQTARQLAGGFADGVAVAELGTMPAQQTDDLLAISGLLLGAVAAPVNPALPSWEALLEWLRPRELLLVLDNAEHIFPACSRLVDMIARSCPRVRVITTSRRPLGFAGERVISLARLEPAAAAELLLRRVAERDSDAVLAGDPAGVARLCQLLDGLPLALELAAAKLRTMSLPALTERITVRPDLLAVEGRPGLAHQRGLFATLRWSYNLLDEPSRLLLTRLAVFAGTFSLADAEQVCGGSPLAEAEVAGLLSGLVDDSLVHITGHLAHTYRLLVPIRDFAIRQAQASDLNATRTRHLRYLCATAELVESADDEPAQRIIAQLESGYCEILAALEWAARDEAADSEAEYGVRLLLAAQPVWNRRHGAVLTALAHAVRALDRRATLPADLAAGLMLFAGHLHFRTGNLDAAKPLLEQVRQLLDDQDPGDQYKRAVALSFLAALACARVEPGAADLIRASADAATKTGDAERAVPLLSVAAEMLAALGHVGEALILIGEAGRGVGRHRALRQRYLTRRAIVYLRADRIPEAMDDLDEVLADQSGITSFDLAASMVTRGYALGRQGRLDAARDTLTEGLRLVHELQAPTLLPDINQALATIETAAGNLPKAVRHVREVLDYTLPRSAVIDAVGALHLAVVLAAKANNPQLAQLAAAVRDCRLASGLPSWPFTDQEYATYEPEWETGRAVPAGPLRHDAVARACDLALSILGSR
jgi:predicted ATPase/DNA-binding SARP family transcriptional activator